MGRVSRDKVRFVAVAVSAALVTVVLLSMFQSAAAVDMRFIAPIPTTVSTTSSSTFIMEIFIPQGNRVPITGIQAIVERQSPTQTAAGAAGKAAASVVARALCPVNLVLNQGCPTPVAFSSEGGLRQGVAVNAITFLGAFRQSLPTGPQVPGNQFASNGPFSGETSGYGYDTISPFLNQGGTGYGYGYNIAFVQNIGGNGYGYGYAGDGLLLRFGITIAGSSLSAGRHYLTVLAHTGLIAVPTISSPFREFEVTGLASGGGGPPTLPGGSTPIAAGQTFNAAANQQFTITSGLPAGVSTLAVTFGQTCTSCKIEVTANTAPPAGTPAITEGFSAVTFLTIVVKDANGNVVSGAISGGTAQFNVAQNKLSGARPQQIVLLRFNNGWRPLDTLLVSAATADPLVFNSTLPGFSEFAVVIDQTPPTISNLQPADNSVVNAVRPVISATLSDNRGVS
ncbi:MAG: hypothetical protein ACT4PT_14130, partial [Methanobacteriota archaeon]